MNQLCDFPDNSPRSLGAPIEVVCRRCGRKAKARVFPLRARCRAGDSGRAQVKQKPQNLPPCIHRGKDVGTIACPTCNPDKNVQLKIFDCAVHGRCTLVRAPGLECCGDCPNYRAAGGGAALALMPPETIRVGFVCPALVVGGIERWIAALMKHIPGNVAFAGIALGDHPPTDTEMCAELARCCPIFAGPGLEYTGRNSPHWITRLTTSQEAVERVAARSDVLIIWGKRERADIPEWFNGRVVLCSHGDCVWTREWVETNLPYATDLAAVSSDAARSFPEDRRDEVTILWNGIEFDRLAPLRSEEDVRQELGIAPEQTIVGFLGRFAVDKNPWAVARAVGELNDDSIVGVFIGRGWEEEKFKQDIQELSRGRCRFVAPPPHLGDYLQAFDCLMVPSPSEGFCLAIAEAWGAAIPVLSTLVGGVRDAERRFGRLTWRIEHDAPAAVHARTIRECLAEGDSQGVISRARNVAWTALSAAAMARNWASYLERICGLPAAQDLQADKAA